MGCIADTKRCVIGQWDGGAGHPAEIRRRGAQNGLEANLIANLAKARCQVLANGLSNDCLSLGRRQFGNRAGDYQSHWTQQFAATEFRRTYAADQ